MNAFARTLSIAVLLVAWSAGAAPASGPAFPPLNEGHAYPCSQAFPTPPAVSTKAPTANAKGVTVVFYAPGSEALEGFIDDLYTNSPGFTTTWDQVVASGMTLQLQWWNFGRAHNGAFGVYDPGHNSATVGIDPNNGSGAPYAPDALRSNIVRGVITAQFSRQIYKDFAPH